MEVSQRHIVKLSKMAISVFVFFVCLFLFFVFFVFFVFLLLLLILVGGGFGAGLFFISTFKRIMFSYLVGCLHSLKSASSLVTKRI